MLFEENEKEEKRRKEAEVIRLRMELKDRFEVVQFVPQGMGASPFYILDKETGVEYLHLHGSTTPLLTPDGKPKVKK